MLWPFSQRRRLRTLADRYAAEHSAWLTRAAARPGRAYPKIPVRRVAEGGFTRMMASETGRSRAARWWAAAFARVED